MWRVELKFGPLAVWRTEEKLVASFVIRALRSHLLRLALSKRLPEPAKCWAKAKLSEIERLIQWGSEHDSLSPADDGQQQACAKGSEEMIRGVCHGDH